MWLELARKGSGHTPQALRKEQTLFKPKQLIHPLDLKVAASKMHRALHFSWLSDGLVSGWDQPLCLPALQVSL